MSYENNLILSLGLQYNINNGVFIEARYINHIRSEVSIVISP